MDQGRCSPHRYIHTIFAYTFDLQSRVASVAPNIRWWKAPFAGSSLSLAEESSPSVAAAATKDAVAFEEEEEEWGCGLQRVVDILNSHSISLDFHSYMGAREK